MEKRKRSKKLDVLKKMPPLYHKRPEIHFEEWNIIDSELLKWALEHDELKTFFTDQLKNSKYIEYNNLTGQWIGIDYKEKCPHDFEDWDECPDCCH